MSLNNVIFNVIGLAFKCLEERFQNINQRWCFYSALYLRIQVAIAQAWATWAMVPMLKSIHNLTRDKVLKCFVIRHKVLHSMGLAMVNLNYVHWRLSIVTVRLLLLIYWPPTLRSMELFLKRIVIKKNKKYNLKNYFFNVLRIQTIIMFYNSITSSPH